MKQVNAFLMSKKMLLSDICHLCFYVPGEGLEFEPGQYGIVTIPASPTPLKRLYSFAGSAHNKNVVELLIRIIPGGAASEYVRELRSGDSVDISGPAGLFMEQKTRARKFYLATGAGIAPIRSFLTSHDPKDLNGTLFWGLHNLSEMYLFDELLSLSHASPSFSFQYCLSQQTSFDTIPADLLHYFRLGRVDAVWKSQTRLIDPLDEYYLCGSRTVVESLRLLLLSSGVAKNRLFFEKY